MAELWTIQTGLVITWEPGFGQVQLKVDSELMAEFLALTKRHQFGVKQSKGHSSFALIELISNHESYF